MLFCVKCEIIVTDSINGFLFQKCALNRHEWTMHWAFICKVLVLAKSMEYSSAGHWFWPNVLYIHLHDTLLWLNALYIHLQDIGFYRTHWTFICRILVLPMHCTIIWRILAWSNALYINLQDTCFGQMLCTLICRILLFGQIHCKFICRILLFGQMLC